MGSGRKAILAAPTRRRWLALMVLVSAMGALAMHAGFRFDGGEAYVPMYAPPLLQRRSEEPGIGARALVVGGAGFVGSRLARFLSETMLVDVVCLDDLSAGGRDSVPGSAAFLRGNAGSDADLARAAELYGPFDVVYEVSGAPQAVKSAVATFALASQSRAYVVLVGAEGDGGDAACGHRARCVVLRLPGRVFGGDRPPVGDQDWFVDDVVPVLARAAFTPATGGKALDMGSPEATQLLPVRRRTPFHDAKLLTAAWTPPPARGVPVSDAFPKCENEGRTLVVMTSRGRWGDRLGPLLNAVQQDPPHALLDLLVVDLHPGGSPDGTQALARMHGVRAIAGQDPLAKAVFKAGCYEGMIRIDADDAKQWVGLTEASLLAISEFHRTQKPELPALDTGTGVLSLLRGEGEQTAWTAPPVVSVPLAQAVFKPSDHRPRPAVEPLRTRAPLSRATLGRCYGHPNSNRVLFAVVTCNYWDMTARLLDGLSANHDEQVDVVVFDDFSTDGTPERAGEMGFRVVQKLEPRGVTHTWNAAYQTYKDECYGFFFIANNDIVVPNGAIDEMAKALVQFPYADAVGPMTTRKGLGASAKLCRTQQVQVQHPSVAPLLVDLPANAQRVQDAVVAAGGAEVEKSLLVILGYVMGFSRQVTVKEFLPDHLFNPANINMGQERSLAAENGLEQYISRRAFVHHDKGTTMRAAGTSADRFDDISQYHPPPAGAGDAHHHH